MDAPLPDLQGEWAAWKQAVHQCTACHSALRHSAEAHMDQFPGGHPFVPAGSPPFDAALSYDYAGNLALSKEELEELTRFLGVQNWLRLPSSYCKPTHGSEMFPWVGTYCAPLRRQSHNFLLPGAKCLTVSKTDASKRQRTDLRRSQEDWTTFPIVYEKVPDSELRIGESNPLPRGVVRTGNLIIAPRNYWSYEKKQMLQFDWIAYRNAVWAAWTHKR